MKGGILGAVCVVVGSAFPTSVHEYTSDDWAPVLFEISVHPESPRKLFNSIICKNVSSRSKYPKKNDFILKPEAPLGTLAPRTATQTFFTAYVAIPIYCKGKIFTVRHNSTHTEWPFELTHTTINVSKECCHSKPKLASLNCIPSAEWTTVLRRGDP